MPSPVFGFVITHNALRFKFWARVHRSMVSIPFLAKNIEIKGTKLTEPKIIIHIHPEIDIIFSDCVHSNFELHSRETCGIVRGVLFNVVTFDEKGSENQYKGANTLVS